jgi:hypothetical protein
MKRSHFRLFLALVLFPLVAQPSGLPEPGLVMYGTLSISNGTPLSSATVTWQVSSLSSVFLRSAMLNVNGQYFYIATVPFETRSIDGQPIGEPTPDTLALNSTPTTYARLATVNGTNATVVYALSGLPNTFTFGPADRGRIERVDLAASPAQTFAQWLAQYGLPATTDPSSDPTHKGMTLEQQFIAGLNPNDPNSLFQFVGIQPVASGVQVLWSSVAGKLYSLQQGTSANGPFTTLQTNIVAAPGTNSFFVSMPTNSASLFLRVLVEQPN